METLDIIEIRHKALKEDCARTRAEAKRAWHQWQAMKNDYLGYEARNTWQNAWQEHYDSYMKLFVFETEKGL